MLKYLLDISYGLGEIGIDSHIGAVTPHIDHQGGFNLETEYPTTSRDNGFPIIVDIDFSQARAEIGTPHMEDAARQWAGEARQYALKHIGEKSAAGDALAAIESGTTIADIVEAETFGDMPESNIAAVPKTPPKVSFEMGHTRGGLVEGKVDVEVSKKPVDLEYHRYNVDIYLAKEPYLTIKALPQGDNIDIRI